MLIALNDRIADGRDVSWIWDVDFERLAPQLTRSVICCGTRAAEMAMRLKYAGVALDRISVRPDMDAALDRLAGRRGGSSLPAGHLHGDARPARPPGAARPGASRYWEEEAA